MSNSKGVCKPSTFPYFKRLKGFLPVFIAATIFLISAKDVKVRQYYIMYENYSYGIPKTITDVFLLVLGFVLPWIVPKKKKI